LKIVWEKRVRGDDGDQVEPPDSPKQSLRVLVVDDYHDCAISLSFLCQIWGHEAQCCFDGVTALKSAESLRPNVFLLDLAMPIMNGFDLAKELRSLPTFQDALFVAVSGYAEGPYRAQAAECGFDHFLPKGVDLTELKHLLSDRQNRLLEQTLPALAASW
jgi:CheY-like chemotaxis protein